MVKGGREEGEGRKGKGGRGREEGEGRKGKGEDIL
jgi:hypothetical protein